MGSIENLTSSAPQAMHGSQSSESGEASITRTLHASWMRDENIFELEKRAIFSDVRLVWGLATYEGTDFSVDLVTCFPYFTFLKAWRLYQR